MHDAIGSTCNDAGRRRARRRTPAADESLSRIRLRTGQELTVINLSDCGVLVEGASRLLPNTHVIIHLVTRTGRTLVRCRVVRACVTSLTGGVTYRVALTFEHPVETAEGYALPAPLVGGPDPSGSSYPSPANPGANEPLERRIA